MCTRTQTSSQSIRAAHDSTAATKKLDHVLVMLVQLPALYRVQLQLGSTLSLPKESFSRFYRAHSKLQTISSCTGLYSVGYVWALPSGAADAGIYRRWSVSLGASGLPYLPWLHLRAALNVQDTHSSSLQSPSGKRVVLQRGSPFLSLTPWKPTAMRTTT